MVYRITTARGTEQHKKPGQKFLRAFCIQRAKLDKLHVKGLQNCALNCAELRAALVVEPRPNVFVSGIKDSVARHVINYLLEKCPEQSGLMIFQRLPNPPGYKLYGMGEPKRQLIELSGLQLVSEKDDASILF